MGNNEDRIKSVMMGAFGRRINAIDQQTGAGKDKGAIFPGLDADDFARGARFIPGEVTLVRRAGDSVKFFTGCSGQCCWYWQMPDGSRIYHFVQDVYDAIMSKPENKCQECGNIHISGGTVSTGQIESEQSSASGKYTPGCNEQDINQHPDQPTLTGYSTQNLLRQEENTQQAVAENPKWLIARSINAKHFGDDKSIGKDRTFLEKLGFKIIGEHDDLFFEVNPPEGWTKETVGYWTTIKDGKGNERGSQFFKGASYDRDAFISIK